MEIALILKWSQLIQVSFNHQNSSDFFWGGGCWELSRYMYVYIILSCHNCSRLKLEIGKFQGNVSGDEMSRLSLNVSFLNDWIYKWNIHATTCLLSKIFNCTCISYVWKWITFVYQRDTMICLIYEMLQSWKKIVQQSASTRVTLFRCRMELMHCRFSWYSSCIAQIRVPSDL